MCLFDHRKWESFQSLVAWLDFSCSCRNLSRIGFLPWPKECCFLFALFSSFYASIMQSFFILIWLLFHSFYSASDFLSCITWMTGECDKIHVPVVAEFCKEVIWNHAPYQEMRQRHVSNIVVVIGEEVIHWDNVGWRHFVCHHPDQNVQDIRLCRQRKIRNSQCLQRQR